MQLREPSGWLDRPASPTLPLGGDTEADVAIVGAGITGLSTALAMRARGADVVVLDRDFAGWGASGRNAGHLTPTVGKDLPSLLMLFGRERASALVRYADRAVEHTERLVERLGIECDYVPAGNLLAAVHPGQADRLRRAAETGRSLGAAVRFVDEGEMRERGLPRAFVCGVLEERGGVLDPGRYVTGLRAAALDAGVRLHEQTPVTAIEDGRRPLVRSARGAVRAERVVLATNAYTPALGWLRRALLPLRVMVIETAPLGAHEREALGWPGREGIYTAHETLESYRLTARGTLLASTKHVRYAFGGELEVPGDEAGVARLEQAMRSRFPELAGVPVARAWGGFIGYPLDFLPSFGWTGAHGRIAYGLAYAGHGVAQATLMGEILAEHLDGRVHPDGAALVRRPLPMPPEPLAWLLFHGIRGGLDLADAVTDRRARPRPR